MLFNGYSGKFKQIYFKPNEIKKLNFKKVLK